MENDQYKKPLERKYYKNLQKVEQAKDQKYLTTQQR